jgi:hypothetical protein
MKLFRYWARGTAQVELRPGEPPIEVIGHGASNVGPDDALRQAVEAAQRAGKALREGRAGGKYSYADRPMREEIVREIREGDRLTAAITRNSYGCLVLNAADTMFIDIDYGPEGAGTTLKRFFGGLFGKKVPGQEQRILERIQANVAATPGLGLRAYRTANGFRCLVTSRTFDPVSPESAQILERFGSDALYVRLCKAQECFRARQTPKHWRCGVPKPPARFPFADAAAERRYRDWVREYDKAVAAYATCAHVASFGEERMDDRARAIVALHDGMCCVAGGVLA